MAKGKASFSIHLDAEHPHCPCRFFFDACYDRGATLCFLILPLNFGAQDLSQKSDWERKSKLLPGTHVPDEKSHGVGSQGGSCKIELAYFRRFWGKEQPHHSGSIFAKKRYTSIVARVLSHPTQTQQELCSHTLRDRHLHRKYYSTAGYMHTVHPRK